MHDLFKRTRRSDTRWWEWTAAAMAFLFILFIVLGGLGGCGLIQGAYESRHNNDAGYWGGVSQQVGKK